MKKPELNDLFLSTSIAILVLLISILIGKALDLLDWSQVFVGVVVSIIIIIGIVGVVWKIGSTTHQEEIIKILTSLRDVAPNIRFHWMVSSEEIDQLEKTIKCKDIWVLSPDLSNDTGKPEYDITQIVKNNLKRGITYTFIVPDTNEIQAVLPHLIQVFSGRPDQLKLIEVPKEVFRSITMTHIAVYNPNMENGELAQLFWELPISDRGYNRGQWIRVADDLTKEMIGRIKALIKNYHS